MKDDEATKTFEFYEEVDIEQKRKQDIKENPLNLIQQIALGIFQAKKIVDYDVCMACGSTLVSSVLPYVRLDSSLGPLPLNEMNLVIGASGTGKTLPFRIVKGMLRKFNLLFPGRYTVEGVEGWFARKVQEEVRDNNGRLVEMRDTDEYVNDPYCTIVTDEISQSFKEAKKEYMAGSIELLSQLYDGELKGTALSRGARVPQSPIYVSFLGATVPEFVPSIPDYFFEQGLAGRINWLFIEPKDELPKFDLKDTKTYYDAVNILTSYKKQLKYLLDLNIKYNPKKKSIMVKFDTDASVLYKKYHDEKYDSWKTNYDNENRGFDWQYKRRLHELVLKKAGLIAVARCADNIIEEMKEQYFEKEKKYNERLDKILEEQEKKIEEQRSKGKVKISVDKLKIPKPPNYPSPQKVFDDIGVRVNKEDMQEAINWINKNERHLKKILFIKKTGIVYNMGTLQVRREVYCPENLYVCLLKSKNRTLNTRQLWSISRISDFGTFKKYLAEALQKGIIVKLNPKSVTVSNEKKRLGLDTKTRQPHVYKAI